MTLKQLRYLIEIVRNNFSVSHTAIALNTSQPAVSKQVKLLEQELRIQIFHRSGRRFLGLTAEGENVISYAERMLIDATNIHQIAEEFDAEKRGALTISTTPTLASYVLPMAVKQFKETFTDVHLHITVGESDQCVNLLTAGEADISFVPRLKNIPNQHAVFKCFHWSRSLIALPDCPLLSSRKLTLEKLAKFPVIAFETPAVSLKSVFAEKGLEPKYAITTSNPEVMKAYAALGMGIGVIATATFNKDKDAPLVARDVSSLIKGIDIVVLVPINAYLRTFSFEFIKLVAPHLTRNVVAQKLNRIKN